jgi:drug/metabolite transporter (DMT)-like permease
LVVLLGLLAAVSFSFGIALQQRGTLSTEADEGDWRFLTQVVRQPVWVFGASLSVLGWVLQTAAMRFGPMLVVQGLVVCSLVITVPVGAWLNHKPVDRRDVVGACQTVAGLVLFLVVGHPGSGVGEPTATRWLVAAAIALVGVAAMARLGFGRGGPTAAALLGIGAGLAFGFQAAVSKMFANEVGSGVAALLGSWSTWALLVCVTVGFAMQQAALKTGSLASAVAATNTTTLLTSVVLGLALFDESLEASGARMALALCGLALAVWGIANLAGVLAFGEREANLGN